jgi:outer membrane receptor for ferrienterochelin and colicin
MSITVGAVGRFVGDKVFDVETSLDSYGIGFPTDESHEGSNSIDYTSEGVKNFGVTVGAQIPNLASGTVDLGTKVKISFNNQYGIAFLAQGLRYLTMQDQPQMARAVAQLAERGQWGRDWHIVTQVATAESVTILISDSSSAEVELALTGEVNVQGIQLMGAEFSPRILSQTNMNTLMVNKGGYAPLFRAKRVKQTFFGNVQLKAGFGPADLNDITDLDDEELERELLEEVDVVDKIVLGRD